MWMLQMLQNRRREGWDGGIQPTHSRDEILLTPLGTARAPARWRSERSVLRCSQRVLVRSALSAAEREVS